MGNAIPVSVLFGVLPLGPPVAWYVVPRGGR